MSTSTWKKVVVGTQRIAFGTWGGRVSGAPSHSGAWIIELGAEHGDAVVVVGDHDVAELLALRGLERLPLGDLAEHSHDRGVDVGAVVEEDLLLPLAEVRGADPDRVVDPGVDEALGAAVDERILTRPRAEALAEEHELRTSIVRERCESGVQRVEQESRLTPAFVDLAEREHRRLRRVLHRHRRAVAVRQELERVHGGVVHVARSGRRVDEQP